MTRSGGRSLPTKSRQPKLRTTNALMTRPKRRSGGSDGCRGMSNTAAVLSIVVGSTIMTVAIGRASLVRSQRFIY
jgi:hypothetical protein